ncbi:unnamed protein product [Urochloa humidicola]
MTSFLARIGGGGVGSSATLAMAVASHGSVLDLNGRSFPTGHSAALIRISDRSQPRPQPQIQGELRNHAIFEVAK